MIPIPKIGMSTARRARDGIVWSSPDRERMALPRNGERVAITPRGTPTRTARRSESATSFTCCAVLRKIEPQTVNTGAMPRGRPRRHLGQERLPPTPCTSPRSSTTRAFARTMRDSSILPVRSPIAWIALGSRAARSSLYSQTAS